MGARRRLRRWQDILGLRLEDLILWYDLRHFVNRLWVSETRKKRNGQH